MDNSNSTTVRTLLSRLLLTVLIFGVGFGAGRLTVPTPVQAQDNDPLQLFATVWQIANQNFIDQERFDEPFVLIYGAINGLLNAMGDEGHTRFLPPKAAEEQKESISGKFYGIGAHVNLQDDLVTIVAPIAGSPAEDAGIKAGDKVIRVDGEEIIGWTVEEAVEIIRGELGTEVVLTVYRPNVDEELDISIIRGEIKLPAATWTFVPGTNVALIRMSQFSANLEENVVDFVGQAKAEGATALILDVRNNPGGLLDQAVRVTSHFLTEGQVLLEEDAQGNRIAYAVQPDGVAPDIPVIVLINQGSASAAEIFAGALQDYERGLVVGETSFGTGTVLQPYDLADGSTLLLGVSQWLTPQGNLIRKQGVTPDVVVELPEDGFIVTPYAVETMGIRDLLNSNDPQLLKALDALDELPSLDLDYQPYWQAFEAVR